MYVFSAMSCCISIAVDILATGAIFFTFPIITVRNSSCGKVTFSQACVKNSVRGGGMHGRGTYMAGGGHGRGACVAAGCMAGGGVWCMTGGHAWRGGACVAGEMASAEDGTHPTGMHFC